MTQEQEHLYELLEFFDDFCKVHELKYYLVGGTLLGAVRHKGFIPWDDDIDVAMPETDYRRFISLKDSLSNRYHILTEDTKQDYPFYFCELCDTNIPFNTGNQNGPVGIYIDIFPLVKSRKPDAISKFLFNIISVIGYILQLKTGWTTYVPYKKMYARVAFCILRMCPVAQLKKLRKQLIDMLLKEGTSFFFSPGGGHKGTTEFYPEEWFDTTVDVQFEGKTYPAPNGWDGYLKQLYGDYMVLPRLEERKTHHGV